MGGHLTIYTFIYYSALCSTGNNTGDLENDTKLRSVVFSSSTFQWRSITYHLCSPYVTDFLCKVLAFPFRFGAQ
jgi:hypothetical protein